MAGEETTNNTQKSNITQNLSVGQLGLNMDSSIVQIKKGMLTYALNANVENFDSNSINYQNEEGNELCLEFPAGYQLIGNHFIAEKNKHVFFLVNAATNQSQIGYMLNNDCVYHTFLSLDCLNFNVNHPIHKAVHKITNCTTEVYWTDGYNPRRYIDLDATAPSNCNDLKVQPDFKIPQLEITDVVNGGELSAGTYQFAIQYSNANGIGYTSYYSVTNPTPIANTNIETQDFNYKVNRSIVLNITNIDPTGHFQYYNIAVIKTINNIQSVELVGTYSINNAARHTDGTLSNQITYTGQNVTQIKLALEEIFEKYPYYEVAEDLTAVQDVLVWDNLVSNDRVNYQKIANDIVLQWQSYRIPSTENYADEINATNYRGYLRDEVYAFEIVFLLKNGKQTDGFHIPGRSKYSYDEVQVPNTNPDFIGEPTSYVGSVGYSPYWKIYNTAAVIDESPEYNTSAGYKGPYQYGIFSYWESLETYPTDVDIWGDLAGTPIRHHKFPDALVSPIFESTTPSLDGNSKYIVEMYKSKPIYPIGVKIDTQQVVDLINASGLTQKEKDDIQGFKIVRGNRSTNKSIVAKGMLRNVGKYDREGTTYYFPNYPYNDLNKDPFLLEKNNAYNSQSTLYKLNVTVAGSASITNCYTGLVTTIILTTGVNNVCSLTKPIPIGSTTWNWTNLDGSTAAPTAPVTVKIVVNIGSTTFLYQNPYNIFQQLSITVTAGSPQYILTYGGYIVQYDSGSKDYTLTSTDNVNPLTLGSNLDAFATDDSKYRQVFNSPETSFGSPTLGSVLRLENVMYGAGNAHFVSVKNNAMYKLITQQVQINALYTSYVLGLKFNPFDATAMFTSYQAYLQVYINGITRTNFAYSFNSIASYDYSATIPNGSGVKQRELDRYQYIFPGVQSVGDTHDINNFQRESSVYLKTAGSTPLGFPNTVASLGGHISDNSRFTPSSVSNCGNPERLDPIKVVSYYGSLKNIMPNQWGQIYTYETIDTGFQVMLDEIDITNHIRTIFGGDTFIGKFGYKTKLPFFIDNRVGAPDDSEIFYDEVGNVAYPQYWHSGRSILYDYQPDTSPDHAIPTLKGIISVKAHNFDCANDPVYPTTSTTTTLLTGVALSTDDSSYTGKMYMFAYGIPYFYCESSINVDLRQAFNSLEGNFYPRVSSGIPDDWFQQVRVPIALDNTYFYNVSYSKQNVDNYFSHLPADWSKNNCNVYYPFRAIYSDQQTTNPTNKVNNWLSYSPLAYFDFPQNYGKLVSLDGIENKAILARFENKSLLYNTLLTINTSNPQAAYLGNTELFKSAPPIDFAETDLGYVGSQNKILLKIPDGQITIDAKRGQIFLLALDVYGRRQPKDLTAFGSGVNRFMTDHLAFELLRYFPEADVDNHFTKAGLHGVYDSKYDRVIISKLDYIPQPNWIGKIHYNTTTKEYFIYPIQGNTQVTEIVQLTNPNYFCNKSWTLSFDMNTKSWISFHSYIPNYYIAENNFFYSGLNGSCDLTAIAAREITPTTTSTTTTAALDCNLVGVATKLP
jgi:hypothetical protein